MPALAIRFEAWPMSSSPARLIEPRRLPTMPMIARRVVVLPAPLRPSRVTTSPSLTVKFIPWRMCDSPYQAGRSLMRSKSFWRTAVSGMPGPHIGFDDLRVLGNLRVGALRQDLPARQNGDGVRQVSDDRQVVLDHQH